MKHVVTFLLCLSLALLPCASGDTVIVVGQPAAAGGGGISYRYYKLTVTKRRDDAEFACQMDEWNLTDAGGTPILIGNEVDAYTETIAYNTSANGPEEANDGNNGTKYYETHAGVGDDIYIVYDFGTAQTIGGYRFVTGNDVPGRDPIRWKVEGSANASAWDVLDDKTGSDQTVTTSRDTAVGPFILP